MASLADVKKEIGQLSRKQQESLLNWMQEEKESRWDERIAQDAAAGKLKHFLERAKADMKAGRCRDLP